jgi:hypothetical protein
MDWTRTIDAYCERTGPGLWDEPFNAWTNLAFWVAAGVSAWAIVQRSRTCETHEGEAGLWVLVGWLAAIGVGSFLFHTYAQVWAALADVGSIVGWIGTFVWLSMRRVLGWGPGRSGLVLTLFFTAAPLSLMVCPLGVCAYLPTLAAAVLLGVFAVRRQRPGGKLLLACAAVFAVSMILAALDGPICEVFPLGTHGFWHLLNATALTLAMLALTRQVLTDATPPKAA